MLLKQKTYGFVDMITFSFKVSAFYSSLFALKAVFDALLPTAQIFVSAYFINTALAIFSGDAVLSAVYAPIALLAGILSYNVLQNVLESFIDCRRKILFRRRLAPEVLEKRAKLEYRHIENPDTADLVSRVCPDLDKKVWDMYSQILHLLNLILFAAGIMITLFSQAWWIAVTMFLTSLPLVYIASKAGKASYDADREVSKIERRADYLSDVLKSREAVEERSIFGYADELNKQFYEQFEFARKFRLKVIRNMFVKLKAGGIVGSLYSIGVMMALIGSTAAGYISIGMFIALVGAVTNLARRLSWGLDFEIQAIAKHKEYLKDLSEFVHLDENPDATALPDRNIDFNVIEFKNVRFRYPDTDTVILDGVSFSIEKGKHYAFVGTNGAGKTTITKLLTGLYSNYEGEILVDGRNLRDFTQAQIKGLTSVVYQDFAKYQMTLFDNVAIADLEDSSNKRKKVTEALELVGMAEFASNLKNGLDTALGKILKNGVDLSGGEWQRTAMARSVISAAPIKILDEPTSALDPISESIMYRNFEKISKTTTIFISHRLGSTKLADTIYVLSDGKIVEKGSHASLMIANGVYSEMFNSQAEWYDYKEVS